jgi:hypothetical protein
MEVTAEKEVAATAVGLAVDVNSIPSETWAATAGPTDII